MRVGSSLTPSYPLPRGPQSAQDATQQAQQEGGRTEAGGRESARPIDLSRLEQEARSRTGNEGFYSMERELSLRSQEALSTYLSTSRFSDADGAGELVGVDLYV